MPTNYQRRRIISLWTQSKEKATFTELERILALEGILTTRQTIKATVNRWKKTGNVNDRPRSGPPKKVPEDHYRCIDNAMAENDELTASDVKEVLIKKFGADKVQYSVRTIGRLRNDLGWTYTTAKYCQAIRDANKIKRLDWFHNVIFTDESTVQLECHWRTCSRKKKTPRKLKYKHKHPPKVHVWSEISKQGATQLVIFDGIMTATRYGDILKASLVPYVQECYPEGHRLYQDNDPKRQQIHSRVLQEFFDMNRISWWKSPAESPDLKPIEKVMPVVVAEQGAPSGHWTVSVTLLHACKHLSFIGFDLLRIVKHTVVGLPHTLVLGWG